MKLLLLLPVALHESMVLVKLNCKDQDENTALENQYEAHFKSRDR